MLINSFQNIALHGGASWLYKLFLGLLSPVIEQVMNIALAEAIGNRISIGVRFKIF